MLDVLETSPPSFSKNHGFTLSAQTISRSFFASLAFLLYDILLTLDEEIELIWCRRKWSLFKVLYFYVRYVPFILQVPLLLVGTESTPLFHFTSKDCFVWEVYQGIVTIAIFAPVDYVLVVRIYALFHSSPLIQVFVSVSYVASVIIMAVGLGFVVPKVTFDEICHTTSVPNQILINGGAEVTFQTILFILTLYKFIFVLREEGWGIVRAIPILRIVVKDGTWAFFVLFTLVAAQAIVYVTGNEGGILFGWVLCAFSFCGYRILLNINHIPHSRRRDDQRRQTHLFQIQSTSYPENTTQNDESLSQRYTQPTNTRSNSNSNTNTKPKSKSSFLSQISQWAEYISPVSFDDWDHGHSYVPGHPLFTSIPAHDADEDIGLFTSADNMESQTNTHGDRIGNQVGIGTGSNEYELAERALA